tara:strand:- start:393 stop:1007 length:615 start_codon:yes stop_codon:yes gene_type:complete
MDNKEIDKNDLKKKDVKVEENNVGEDKKSENSLEDKVRELDDKLARAYAEIENQRRRFEKEKEDALEYGGFAFAKEALNLIDNLERSKISLENDEKLKNTEALKKIFDHLKIINDDMISIFSKNNIKQIKSLNEKLDPNLHQAMMEVEDNSKDPGTIVQEIQKGFIIKDRLLRPALVAVSKKSSKNDNEIKKGPENKEKNTESN